MTRPRLPGSVRGPLPAVVLSPLLRMTHRPGSYHHRPTAVARPGLSQVKEAVGAAARSWPVSDRPGRGRVRAGPPGDVWADQRAADVGDIDDSGQAGVSGDRQVPEMAAGHDLGCVSDGGPRFDPRPDAPPRPHPALLA